MASLYSVQRIVGKRIRDSKYIEYKVKWDGYSSTQNTWEPIKNLKNVQNLIEEFEDRNKNKLPPLGVKQDTRSNKFATNLAKKIEEQKGKSKQERINTNVMKQEKKRISKEPRTNNSRLRKQVDEMEQQLKDCEAVSLVSLSSELLSQELKYKEDKDEEDLMDIHIDKIADKIIAVASSKRKNMKIINVVKGGFGNTLNYIVEDQQGKRFEHDRQYMMKFLASELISFYERRLDEEYSRGQN